MGHEAVVEGRSWSLTVLSRFGSLSAFYLVVYVFLDLLGIFRLKLDFMILVPNSQEKNIMGR